MMSMLSQLALLVLATAPQEIELLSRAAAPIDALPAAFIDASADSRYVLVSSRSSNVVPGQVDSEDSNDLFLVDRLSNTSQLVTHLGDQVTCGTDVTLDEGAMSDDGSVVVFLSREEGLVAGFDSLGWNQAYRYSASSGAIVPLTRSTSNSAQGGNGSTFSIDIDGAGRVAVISSNATDLVPGFVDGGTGADAYGFNLATGAPFLVAMDATNPNRGAQGSGPSGSVAVSNVRISNSGTQVYFQTAAVNLVAGFQPPAGSPFIRSVFRRDLVAGTTTLVTHAAGSTVQAASQGGRIEDISADGERLVFTSESDDLLLGQVSQPSQPQVFVFDGSTGQNRMVSHLPGQPQQSSVGFGGPARISDDGRWVAYAHGGSNLLAGGVDTNGRGDLFVYDLTQGQTVHLVTHVAGQPNVADTAAGLLDQGFQIDATGSAVAFSHTSDQLLAGFSHPQSAEMNSYRRDLSTGSLELLSRDAGSALIGANESDTVAHLSADATTVFRRGFAGNLDSGTVGDGGVLYASGAPGLTPEPVLRRAGTSSVSADGNTSLASLAASLRGVSDDGRWVLLMSSSSNLAPGIQRYSNGPSLYLADVDTGSSRLVSHVGNGLTTTYSSAGFAGISGDGRTVVFSAIGTGGLVPGFMDDGMTLGLYAQDVSSGATETLSSSSVNVGLPSGGTPFLRGVSDDGRFVLYETAAPDVVPGIVDVNNESDIVLVDRSLGSRVLVSRAAGTNQAADGRSRQGWLSADGQLVVFQSRATNLVAGFVDGNGSFGDDVYAYDVASGAVRLVSRSLASAVTGGDSTSYGPQVAAEGTIVFRSLASDLVAGFVDRNFLDDDLFRVDPSGVMDLAVSDASQALEGTDNGPEDFLLSRDGASLVVLTNAGNLVPGFLDRNGSFRQDLFHVDFASGSVQVIGNRPGHPTTGGDGDIKRFDLAGNGRRVAWISDANDVIPGQAGLGLFNNVFVRDLDASTTTLVTLRPPNTGIVTGATDPFVLSLSGNGAYVDFVSSEREFVAADLNGASDAFRFDLGLQCSGTSICSGAANSTGSPATLCLSGSQVAAANALTVTVEGLPLQVFGLFVTSSDLGFLANPGGSLGDLCINGPTLGRYNNAIFSSGAAGSASIRVDLARIPSGGQFVAAVAGSTHHWQCWYRDVIGGAAVSNLSEARAVQFR